MGSGSSTQTNRVPDWVEQFGREGVLPFAQGIADKPFEQYTGNMVAPVGERYGQVADVYNQLGSAANMTPEDYQSLIQRNLSGFTTNVIDPTVAALERRYAQERVGEAGNVIGSGAFDSSRRAVYEGEREAGRDIGMAQTLADLQSQAYTQAANQTMNQLGVGQQALGTQAAGLTGVAQTEQTASQAALDAAYNEFLRGQDYPLTQLGALTSAISGVPYTTTSTSSSRPGFAQILGAIGSTGEALTMFANSDVRLKKNIQHMATEGGVKYYRWEWNDTAKNLGLDITPPMGVLAQELQEIYPELVSEGKYGYLQVDYAGLAKKQAEAA